MKAVALFIIQSVLGIALWAALVLLHTAPIAIVLCIFLSLLKKDGFL